MAYSTVLFDLDGTLTDPGVGIANSAAHALAAIGREPLSDRQLAAFVGPPLQEAFAALGFDTETCTVLVRTYREYFAEQGILENRVYPGIEEMLERLRENGTTLAVATSKPLIFARRVLRHFGLDTYFAQVSGPELDGTRRHKHEVIADVLARLGRAAGADVVMVGDREHDVQGARRAGLDCVGVTWGYGAGGELVRAGAVRTVANRAELLAALTD